jgi:hypothetical protein
MGTLAQRTASEFFVTVVVFPFELGRFGVIFDRVHTKQSATVRQFLAAMTVPQETVITDAMKATWQHMN